ncbi:ankyrin repeat-containing protein NPR4-like isoform X1 [Papaver somniferum]|uniref:ankyrin repeat-containing protein NPR4-like isoform X1 n=1 Tax=Papaver somniferum TaxID=3469 RepID=UPI000E6FB398|nr:ankyrin repeat-containing protein NPR4-like isoform X1 [Papaver somniferum]XP_026448998.1 ankyrin repeat-containing protein NPR4-like isoform X1 [Papaver somniferum]XP_026448999.1 ankyrin repeat-containing protein NPR4-like isoform X1 [Papaver somniferum]
MKRYLIRFWNLSDVLKKIDVIICNEDENCNNILHHTAMLAPPQQLNSVSGAALQMQRELQWFQGVARLVHPFLNHTRNVYGKTAQYVFTEQHKSLREAGEKWLKDTSESCMLVATLIATVAFAAAFTVPGGNVSEAKDPKNGLPVFLKNNTFSLYAAADAVALFSSVTSVVMFLAIMTSRYAEQDFLKSLPKKLIIGLATLFISMASILVGFGAAFTLILTDRYSWAPIPIACFGFISVLLFFLLEFPLFVELMRVTYWPSVLHKKNRQPLFSEKEKLRTFQRDRIKQFLKKEKEY